MPNLVAPTGTRVPAAQTETEPCARISLDGPGLLRLDSSVELSALPRLPQTLALVAGIALASCADPATSDPSKSIATTNSAVPETNSAPPESIDTFTWRHTFGPCPPNGPPCSESLTVTKGVATQDAQGAVSQATVPGDTLSELDAFLVDPAFRIAIADPAPCSSPDIIDDVIVVNLLTATGTVEVSKNLTACDGPEFVQLDAHVDSLQRLFLP
jgi:hypothetical protein